MRISLTALMIFFGLIHIHSQELKKITIKNKNAKTIEEFYVLKSDRSIKHGEYIKMPYSGKIIEKGYFKNNKKDSVWIYFAFNGIDTVSIGKYSEDKPIGIWITNDNKGILKYVYDYSKEDVIEYNWFDTPNKFPILIDGKWVEDAIDSPPLMIGKENPSQFISRNVKYPTRAMENGVSGQVLVAFTVDSGGRMSDIKLKKGVDADLDAEAIRTVKLLDTVWFPAKKNGHKITIEYFLPINFILQ